MYFMSFLEIFKKKKKNLSFEKPLLEIWAFFLGCSAELEMVWGPTQFPHPQWRAQSSIFKRPFLYKKESTTVKW
jgi:hypothetical protein